MVTYWYNSKNPNSTPQSLTTLNSIDGTQAQLFHDDFKLPWAGDRGYYNGNISRQESDGLYWSSTPTADSVAFLGAVLISRSYFVGITNGSNTFRANGSSVRCFKDSPDAPVTRTITFYENG